MLPPPDPARGRGREAPSRPWLWLAPALLGGLAGDAEPSADVGPGAAVLFAQPGDGLAGGVLDVGAEVGDEGQCLDVAAGDAAGASQRGEPTPGGRPRFPRPVVARRYAPTGTGTARRAAVGSERRADDRAGERTSVASNCRPLALIVRYIRRHEASSPR